MLAIPRQSVNLTVNELKILFRAIVPRNLCSGAVAKDFETRFAQYIGVKYAIALSSGRAAQFIALKALELDFGSEIIVPAYTFYIVPVMVKLAGLSPIFVDVQSSTYNVNPDEIEKIITPRTRGIIVTHIAGMPCNMDKMCRIAQKYKLYIIEDCAQACGSEYNGRKVGSFGHISYFSFHPSKNMTCLGGGMAVTNDERIFNRMRQLCNEKCPSKIKILKEIIYTIITYLFTRRLLFTLIAYPVIVFMHLIGKDWIDKVFEERPSKLQSAVLPYIAKMADVQAQVGIEQLRRLDLMNSLRIKNALLMREALKTYSNVQMQEMLPGYKNTYLYMYLQVTNKRYMRKRLIFAGVDSKEDGLSVCSKLNVFAGAVASYPIAEQLVNFNIELPNYPFLREKDICKIIHEVKRILSVE